MKVFYKYTALAMVLFFVLTIGAGCAMGGEMSEQKQETKGIAAKLIAAYEKLSEAKSYTAEYSHDDGHSEATDFAVSLTVEDDTAGAVKGHVAYDSTFWHYTDLVYKPYKTGEYYFDGEGMHHYQTLVHASNSDVPALTYKPQSDINCSLTEGFYRQIFAYLDIESFAEMAVRFAEKNVLAVATEDGHAYALKGSYFEMLCIFMGEEAQRARDEMESLNNEETIRRENARYDSECELTFYINSEGILSGIYFKQGENDIETTNRDHFFEEISFRMYEINGEHTVEVPEWAKTKNTNMKLYAIKSVA